MKACSMVLLLFGCLSCLNCSNEKSFSYHNIDVSYFDWTILTDTQAGYLSERNDTIYFRLGGIVLVVDKNGKKISSLDDSAKLWRKENWTMINPKYCERFGFDLKCNVRLKDTTLLKSISLEHSNYNRRHSDYLQQLSVLDTKSNVSFLLFDSPYIIVYDVVQFSDTEVIILFTHNKPLEGVNPPLSFGLLNLKKIIDQPGIQLDPEMQKKVKALDHRPLSE